MNRWWKSPGDAGSSVSQATFWRKTSVCRQDTHPRMEGQPELLQEVPGATVLPREGVTICPITPFPLVRQSSKAPLQAAGSAHPHTQGCKLKNAVENLGTFLQIFSGHWK